MSLQQQTSDLLAHFGVPTSAYTGRTLAVTTPITGETIAQVATTRDPAGVIAAAHKAFLEWRTIPAPRRGELVRLLGEELRAEREHLGRLVTIEAGKILS